MTMPGGRWRGARLLLILALLAAGCGGKGREVPTLTTEELAAALEETPPPFLLDVRTPGEFAAGHIPGAVLVPAYEVEKRASELAKYGDRTLVVYCEVGARSARAARTLLAKGFPHVVEYHGGMRAWRKAGLEVER
jgi:rhodanese-related sulfurtransferase